MVEKNQKATQVTAKVKLQSKAEYLSTSYDGSKTTFSKLDFVPNYAPGKNAEWATATPSLSFSMTVRNEVATRFAVGDEYEVTFKREG